MVQNTREDGTTTSRSFEFETDGLKVTLTVEVTKELLDLRRDDRMFLNTLLDTTEEWRKKAHAIKYESVQQAADRRKDTVVS